MRPLGTALLIAVLLALPGPAAAAAPDPLLAPEGTCRAESALDAAATAQERAMRCLTAFARETAGRPVLESAPRLFVSAGLKSRDILRCDQFDHEACGRGFSYWIERSGYIGGRCWSVAENIACGTGSRGTARSILAAWLGSSGHRENILGSYRDIGVGLRVGSLGGDRGAHVWTQHFGGPC